MVIPERLLWSGMSRDYSYTIGLVGNGHHLSVLFAAILKAGLAEVSQSPDSIEARRFEPTRALSTQPCLTHAKASRWELSVAKEIRANANGVFVELTVALPRLCANSAQTQEAVLNYCRTLVKSSLHAGDVETIKCAARSAVDAVLPLMPDIDCLDAWPWDVPAITDALQTAIEAAEPWGTPSPVKMVLADDYEILVYLLGHCADAAL
jgi:hypothetical protein